MMSKHLIIIWQLSFGLIKCIAIGNMQLYTKFPNCSPSGNKWKFDYKILILRKWKKLHKSVWKSSIAARRDRIGLDILFLFFALIFCHASFNTAPLIYFHISTITLSLIYLLLLGSKMTYDKKTFTYSCGIFPLFCSEFGISTCTNVTSEIGHTLT